MQSLTLGAKQALPLTIAMAVYNAERYLKSAIENILSQTYSEYELLIIDDGSVDSSRTIIKELAETDNRIRFILKDSNEGLSSVRNLSIKEARGKYLIMIDADDLFDRDTFAMAMNAANQHNADVVIWDFDTFNSDDMLPTKTPSSLDGLDANNRHALIYLPAFMPVRLLRTEYVRSRHIEFPMGLTKQDIPVHWRMVTDREANIILLPERLFHYRQHRATTSCKNDRSLFSLVYVMDMVESDLKKYGSYDEFRTDYIYKKLTLLHGMYDFISPEFKNEAMHMITERLNSDAMQYISKQIEDLPLRTQLFYKSIEGYILARIKYNAFILLRRIKRAIR